MRVFKIVGVVLFLSAAVAALTFVGLAVWVYISASTVDEPDRRSEFHEPFIPDHRRNSSPDFATAIVGDRYEIVDHLGRVVFFRGMNVGQGSASPPFQPIAFEDEAAFEQMQSFGVNAIRLLVPWESLTPRPREFDLGHLAWIRWVMDAAKRHDMVVVVDNYQEGGSRCFGGVGAPAWAHRPGTAPDDAMARQCDGAGRPGFFGLPGYLKFWADFWDAAWTPDDKPLQDHLTWAFFKLAEVLQKNTALLGYGLFDRPPCPRGVIKWLYPGEADCVQVISAFYRRLSTSIRNTDPDALLFFERPVPMGDDEGRSWADMEFEAPPEHGRVMSVAERGEGLLDLIETSRAVAGDVFGAPLVLSEFGRGDSTRDGLERKMRVIEDTMVSAFLWNYSRHGIGAGDTSVVAPADVVDDRDLAGTPRCFASAFVRPYPRRVAGIPISFSFDREGEGAGVFILKFTQGPVAADTVIFVPRTLVYGEDRSTEAPEFYVDVSDGKWEWSRLDPNILQWSADPGVEEHTIEIRPWGGGEPQGHGLEECL